MKYKKTAKSTLDKLRVSPRKLGLLAKLIRNMPIGMAINALSSAKKRVALDVKKALLSAVANAENNHNMDVDTLFVDQAYVGKSITLKRFQACAKGRGVAIRKPFSNITIVLVEKEV